MRCMGDMRRGAGSPACSVESRLDVSSLRCSKFVRSRVGQTIGVCRLLGWAAGPRNSMKNSGNAGDLVAGDLPEFPELRGGFSTLSTFRAFTRHDRPQKAMVCPTCSIRLESSRKFSENKRFTLRFWSDSGRIGARRSWRTRFCAGRRLAKVVL
jgi:hypothetical protein